ncbi:hypothetical protein Sden_0061 [Shewanella denitrificans OS217]|jgi:hypothetical protein|uniref:Uncharacterized protein n=1 Tax=Shewanella denitrificans (strain OS217 / ATCC BAA-1090 / DSM 15013) TaxID=318161 RepID=Q12T68_SHEDO|nr:hypothetical protein [Shewanella denitrificans]ABE53358.1 hypothetical protein Sden_0061 [Shewanella denitrificans OS217]
MVGVKLPNCWSELQRIDLETKVTKKVIAWLSEWLLQSADEVNWHWNSTLFACAKQKVRMNELQWVELAHFAMTGECSHVQVTKKLSLLAEQMKNELQQLCEIQAADSEQCAAVLEIRLHSNLIVCIPIPIQCMPTQVVVPTEPISSGLIEKMIGDCHLSLQCHLDSLPMTLEQIYSLKTGDRVRLKHRFDSEITLSDKSYHTNIKGFLASFMGHRSIVIK